jgi:hypothetical protein
MPDRLTAAMLRRDLFLTWRDWWFDVVGMIWGPVDLAVLWHMFWRRQLTPSQAADAYLLEEDTWDLIGE